MGGQDPYEVLGVNRNASEDEIKEAYREKVKRYHPDACDKENAEELFKQIKDAYETLQSGGSADTGSGSGQRKSSPNTSSNSTRKRSGQERERAQKRTSKREGRNRTNQSTTGADEHEEGQRRSAARNQNRKKGGFEADPSQWNTESDDTPDGFEVTRRFDDGWLLGRRNDAEAEDGRWFVFKEFETAPHVEQKEFMFLADDGAMTKGAVYFETSAAAEEAYRSEFGEEETDEEYEHEQEGQETHRKGYSPKGESHTHVSKEKGSPTADEGGWGERKRKTDLDTLWSLYYQEKKRGNQKRWAVVASVVGDNRFINDDGEYQETEFWFEGRKEAENAHKRYMRKVSSVGEERETRGQPSQDAGAAQNGQSVSASVASGVAGFTRQALRRARNSTDEISPVSMLLLPLKLVLGLALSPFLAILKLFSFFGVGRVFGAIAVAVVGPLMLLFMRLILPPMVVGTSPLGGITVAESFVWISIPALVVAGFLQVLYESSYFGFLTGY
jgi:hypothetical protein